MRDADPEAIQLELDSLDETPAPKPQDDEETGLWLKRLLSLDPSAIEDLLEAFPGMERQQVRQLLRNTQKKGAASLKAQKALEDLIADHINRTS